MTDNQKVYSITNHCRLCNHSKLVKRFFIKTPLANNLLNHKIEKVDSYPLTVIQCEECGAVQLKESVNPNLLFSYYLYASSQSGNSKNHFEQYAKEVLEFCKINTKELIVEIGGNDGVLAYPIKKMGYNVINVEPAQNLAKISKSKGILTKNSFFDKSTVDTIVKEYGKAKLIITNNCFAHIPDIQKLLKNICLLLNNNGWFVFENAYYLDTIQNLYFDQYYHEHIFYHLVKPLVKLLNGYGLEIKKIERNNQQGGSIRVFSKKTNQINNDIITKSFIQNEETVGMYNNEIYQSFNQKLDSIKNELFKIITKLKKQNKTITGYGYPAKATTFLSYFKIAPFLDYIVEDSEMKVGKFSPLDNIPIVNKQHFIENPPDSCIILAWNFSDLIKKNNPHFKKWLTVLPKIIQ